MNKLALALLLLFVSAVADDTITDSGNAFSASVVVDAWTGANAFAYLYNPSNSGKTVYVDKIVTTHNASVQGGSGCDIRSHNSHRGTFRTFGKNKFIGLADSSAKLMYGNVMPHEIFGSIVYECWQPARLHDGHYEFKEAFRLPPGYGIAVWSAHQGTYLIATFEFREY